MSRNRARGPASAGWGAGRCGGDDRTRTPSPAEGKTRRWWCSSPGIHSEDGIRPGVHGEQCQWFAASQWWEKKTPGLVGSRDGKKLVDAIRSATLQSESKWWLRAGVRPGPIRASPTRNPAPTKLAARRRFGGLVGKKSLRRVGRLTVVKHPRAEAILGKPRAAFRFLPDKAGPSTLLVKG